MFRLSFRRTKIWTLAPLAAVLFAVAACGASDEQASPTPATDANAIQTEVAVALATQADVQKQIDDSVAATMAAQAPSTTPDLAGGESGEVEPSPTATTSVESTLEPSPTATQQPAPTATPEPPAPTATSAPSEPTATPAPPQPTPTPTEVPPTPTPESPEPITFDRPDNGRLRASGENGSFAQASASFDTSQFPARTFVRSGVYFGINEEVTANGIVENSFVPEETGTIRITADAGWNGELWTKGWGDMASSFDVRLAIVGPDGALIKAPVSSGKTAINSNVASKPVSGNGTLVLEALVEGGQSYTIQLMAVCWSTGSFNVWASDTECAFDSAAGGYVEWRSLTVEYLP